jgi:hypothetical protein
MNIPSGGSQTSSPSGDEVKEAADGESFWLFHVLDP